MQVLRIFSHLSWESWLTCNDCHRQFKSQRCHDQHKKSRGDARPVCERLIKCTKCQALVRRCKQVPEKHHCGQGKCGICGKHVPLEGHRCYIQPETKKKKKPTPEEEEEIPEDGYDVSVFLDTECRQGEREFEDEPVEESKKELLFFEFECRQENWNHEPTLCIVQNEAGDEWIFQGDDTRDEFCEWLFTTEHPNCTVIAQNFQSYDSYVILQYLREQSVKYKVIMRGAKVLSLEVDLFNIQLVDSLNFIPMKLANPNPNPKTFGIEELAKGYFPHLFNKKENENYIGPIPPAPYYNPNGMNPKDRETFMAWHQGMRDRNYVFNFKEEILAYCRSDVDLLRELLHNVTDIDPFRTLTIASACHLVYRTNYLPKNTIAIIPPWGYRNNQSLFAHK